LKTKKKKIKKGRGGATNPEWKQVKHRGVPQTMGKLGGIGVSSEGKRIRRT